MEARGTALPARSHLHVLRAGSAVPRASNRQVVVVGLDVPVRRSHGGRGSNAKGAPLVVAVIARAVGHAVASVGRVTVLAACGDGEVRARDGQACENYSHAQPCRHCRVSGLHARPGKLHTPQNFWTGAREQTGVNTTQQLCLVQLHVLHKDIKVVVPDL